MEEPVNEGPMTRARAKKVYSSQSQSSLDVSGTGAGFEETSEAEGSVSSSNETNQCTNGNVNNLEITTPATETDTKGELGTRTAICLLMLIFTSSVLVMALVWTTFPDMDPQDQQSFKFPKDLEDAKKLGVVLSRYKDQYFTQVTYLHYYTSAKISDYNRVIYRCFLDSCVSTSFCKHLPFLDQYFSPSSLAFYFRFHWHCLQFVFVPPQVCAASNII